MLLEQRLLKFLALSHIIGGLVLTTFLFLKPLHPFILQILYSSDSVSNQDQIFFWLSILGPTIASWGVLFYLSVTHYFQHPTRHTLKMMAASILIWAPLDTGLCIYNEIYLAAVANALVLFIFILLFFRVKHLASQ